MPTCYSIAGSLHTFILASMLLNVPTAVSLAESTEICMPTLGCFSTAPPFSHLPLPWHRDVINTRFDLRTRENPNVDYNIQVDNVTSLQLSNFRTNTTTYVGIHGYGMFKSGIGALPKEQFFQVLLTREDANVVYVDWSGGARTGLDYLQAASNARVVAAELVYFCRWLKRYTGIPFESLHLVGFSFGAHVAGLAGHQLKHVGRITALDPASPGYEKNPPKARLDHTDAIFVDVIHTDGQVPLDAVRVSIGDPVGHVDFYPNGGLDQPGCGGLARFLDCDHKRASTIFLDAMDINTPPLRAYRCRSHERFLAGLCTKCRSYSCMDMVVGSTRIPRRKHVKMFLQTMAEQPFRVFHYSVKMHFRRGRNAAHVGHLKITLHGSEASSQEIALNSGTLQQILPGHSKTFLVTSSDWLGTIRGVSFHWDHEEESNQWQPFFSWFGISLSDDAMTEKKNRRVVHVRKIRLKSGETQDRKPFCSPDSLKVSGIPPKMVVMFSLCDE